MIALDFLKSELNKYNLELNPKTDEREGVDFLVGNKQLYIQSLDIDTQRSIKISKQVLGEPNDNLFVALILIISQVPQIVYCIPSTQLTNPDGRIFLENEITGFPSLSNWEIRVFTNAIPELVKFSLKEMKDKL